MYLRGYYFWACTVPLIWHLNSLLQYDIHMISPTYLEETLRNFFHEIFVFMEGRGRELTDYVSITREYSIFVVYDLAKACRNWLRKITNQY